MKISMSILVVLFVALQISTAQETVTLTCVLKDCGEQIGLYRFNGVNFESVQSPQVLADTILKFSVQKVKEPRFYYIGQGSSMRLLLLGTEKEVQLAGSCRNIAKATTSGSLLNEQYDGLKKELADFKRRTGLLIRKFRMSNSDEKAKAVEDMKVLDAQKIALLDSLKKAQPFLAKIAALETYTSYDGNENKDKYANEIEYFAAEFFRFVDFKDKTYEQLPWVHEAFRNYAGTLCNVGLPDEEVKAYIDKQLQVIPQGSQTRLMAMSGVVTVLKQAKNANFVPYAEAFIKEFKDKVPAAATDLQRQLDAVKSFEVGGTAPDFTQKTPAGEEMKLSDLRGKVVLVDFWASWCGPCRRENPNVVKMYNEYKDKGFEILGVSLDQDKGRWLQAIEKDGLTWRHVSDLKGWQNEVAQLYSVSAIPHTILLDAEGKIIARNLRGPALENKLAELFE
ncbi:MAG: TlpA disulfide reductase family protein [Saprospiraceae bacterium]|nr:TlpA disulfide reductase family protein [Saprospiraceae bacterium]